MVGLYGGWDAENEGMFIAKTIERLLAESPQDRVAVLYRTNSQSRQIEEALRRHGRKYLVVGGFSFYQRSEIKDAVAYLKLAMSNQDSVSLLRVINTPARGIGRTTVEQVDAFAREHELSLWDAVSRMIDQQLFPARAQSALVAFRTAMQEITLRVASEPLPDAIRFMLDRTGYGKMLEQENTPESEARLENLGELVNAAAEAAERGESLGDFLDHAALVADADAVDEHAQVSLLTLHNAKGLEFPIVFLAGMEEGLFPHQRSMASVEALEEERRLCYVGMTRAQRRLYLTWAKYRRRFGGGEQERTVASRFLAEAPQDLITNLGDDERIPQVDLHSERHQVRQTAERNMFTGKTYNSLENISQFFADRGVAFPATKTPPVFPQRAAAPAGAPAKPAAVAQPPRRSARTGMTVEHPKYGTGTVVRREGEGEDAKITVSFPRYGLKKLVEKYAGLKRG
jgi:DNA helicase-2/ATP-dependent DNA helicase PcrA